MKDDTSNEKDSHNYIWEESRSNASSLPASSLAMDSIRKELICKAIELDIIDTRTYAGYRGDLWVEFTTLTHHTVRALKRIAEGLKMEVVVKQNAVMVF